MAIPDTLAARLIETTRLNGLSGAFVMLGRQRWVGARRGASADLLDETLAQHLPGTAAADLADPGSIYSETFFRRLGFAAVDSMDFSDYEGASLIQDLSAPLSPALEERFDVVYDGGTCEHVFELPTALRNIDRMLKPGGVLIGHSPANNWVNHGFYQLTPELVFGFWEKAMGYEVLHCRLQPLQPRLARVQVEVTNPNVTGLRPRFSRRLEDLGGLMLDYAVRKPVARAGDGRAYQTDYLSRWDAQRPALG